MSKNGHNTSCTRTMYLRKKEKRRYIISSLHPSKRNNTPPNTMIQKLTLPLRVTTLISKTTHIQNYITIIIIIIIIIIILSIRIKSHWMRWGRSRLRCKTAHSRLPSCNTTDTNVHLIQLRRECIQTSIHALQLRHDIS